MNRPVHALTTISTSGGEQLAAGGFFMSAGGLPVRRIATWDGRDWNPLGQGLNGPVYTLTSFQTRSAHSLVAGGHLEQAIQGPVGNRVMAFGGSQWQSLQGGVSGCFGVEDYCFYTVIVTDSASLDLDGAGPAASQLFISGNFTSAGGVLAETIARWDGSQWHALPDPGFAVDKIHAVDASVFGQAQLIATFHSFVDDPISTSIASWNGSAWTPLGTALSPNVGAMAVFDDGSGPALFVGSDLGLKVDGVFTAMAKWDGRTWTTVGGSLRGSIHDMAVFDDGSGPALYVGGEFNAVNGVRARNLARWDGREWRAVGNVDGIVHALKAFDGGLQGGPALVVGGSFTHVDGLEMNNIAMLRADP